MKMQWKEANRAQDRDNEKYLGEYRSAPEDVGLYEGCWYYNKVTGRCYEWSVVEEKSPKELADSGEILHPAFCTPDPVVYDFSRTPNSGSNITPVPQWHELDLLPPVGTECEIAASTEHLKINYPEGTKVKIYANFTDDRGVSLAAFVDSIGKVGGIATANCFRPLKTERERAIEEILVFVDAVNVTNDQIATALYDAGYRKGEK